MRHGDDWWWDERDRKRHNRALAALIAAAWVALMLGHLAVTGISDNMDRAVGFGLVSGVICVALNGAVHEER